jgi:hypothetical protein
VFPFIRLGPFLLQIPGLARRCVGGFVAGRKEANHLKLNAADVYNLFFADWSPESSARGWLMPLAT